MIWPSRASTSKYSVGAMAVVMLLGSSSWFSAVIFASTMILSTSKESLLQHLMH